MSLTDRQQRFVEEYLIDLNATQAAIRAGYAKPNQQGPRLLVNVGVREAIKERQDARSERMEISVDSITSNLMVIAGKAEAMDVPAALSVARQSLMDIAKLNGLVIDTHENVNRSPEERSARLAELRAERDRLARTH